MIKYILTIALYLSLIALSTTSYAIQRLSSAPAIFSVYKARINSLVKNNPYQLSVKEYTLIAKEIVKKAPCNILVFGVGNDSSLWLDLNKRGLTVFLEDNKDWLSKIKKQIPELKAHLVRYNHKRSDYKKLLAQVINHPQFVTIPPYILTIKWDIIFVDAPAGWSDETPGRMSSIYLAALLAQKNKNTQVFVHDCDREVEALYTSKFLKDKNLKQTVDRLRHYSI